MIVIGNLKYLYIYKIGVFVLCFGELLEKGACN
jgi:hypothetical protein